MDVVYVVGKNPDNEELRYSLRSLANVPHDTVWIVGWKPKWCVNVEYLPTRQNRSKFQNSTANLLTACTYPDVSDDFQYWNDDFFALQPTEVPTCHRGEVKPARRRRTGQQFRRSSSYLDGLEATRQLLAHWGHDPVLSYELHLPMVINKQRMSEVIGRAARDWQIVALNKRTLYGNAYEIGGEQRGDVKVGNRADTWREGQVWVSTTNKSFDHGKVGKRLRELFSEPSPYEGDA